VACGLGNRILNGGRRTAPAALGRFHAERAFGLPMAEKSVGGVLPSLTIQKGKSKMSTWSKDELRKIAEADDLHISPFREDGATYGTPTWIWSVTVDDALYVRGYTGQNSRWYQAAVRQTAGRIIAAGMTKEVTFEPVDGPINSRIDDAYRAKYHDSPYLSPMINARARSATVKIMPSEK
jgi:hypothetical protein